MRDSHVKEDGLLSAASDTGLTVDCAMDLTFQTQEASNHLTRVPRKVAENSKDRGSSLATDRLALLGAPVSETELCHVATSDDNFPVRAEEKEGPPSHFATPPRTDTSTAISKRSAALDPAQSRVSRRVCRKTAWPSHRARYAFACSDLFDQGAARGDNHADEACDSSIASNLRGPARAPRAFVFSVPHFDGEHASAEIDIENASMSNNPVTAAKSVSSSSPAACVQGENTSAESSCFVEKRLNSAGSSMSTIHGSRGISPIASSGGDGNSGAVRLSRTPKFALGPKLAKRFKAAHFEPH